MRSRWLSMLWFLGVLLMLPFPISAQVKGLKKVHVGVPAISMGNIIIYFSKEAKIYEKHGLDAEPVSHVRFRHRLQSSDRRQRDHIAHYHSSGDERGAGGFGYGDFGPHDAGRDSIAGGAAGHKTPRGSQGKNNWRHDVRVAGRFPCTVPCQAKGTQSGQGLCAASNRCRRRTVYLSAARKRSRRRLYRIRRTSCADRRIPGVVGLFQRRRVSLE